jgi:hypothetical protein
VSSRSTVFSAFILPFLPFFCAAFCAEISRFSIAITPESSKRKASQMDLYNGVASAWMHHQPSSTSDSSPQLTQHEGQPSTDDWKDRSTPAVAVTSQSSQPSLDLSEFTMDLPGEQLG